MSDNKRIPRWSWLNQTTRDWHSRVVTLSETKGLSERFFAPLRMTRSGDPSVKCTNVLWFAVVAFILLVTSATAIAHESRPAYLELTERTAGHYEVTWRRPALGEQVLALAPRFPVNCHDATPHTIQKTAGAVLERWQLVCDASGLVGHTITIEGLSRTITDVLVRVTLRAGSSETHIAHAHAPSVVIHGAPTSLAVAGSYLRLGIEHIWSGIDHLLFVLGLLLLVQRRWALLKTITAFTIAHSITLGLATLGVVHIPQAPVEAVIALSILFLAVELARERLQPPESRLVHQECHPECNEGSLREILRSAQNDSREEPGCEMY